MSIIIRISSIIIQLKTFKDSIAANISQY